VKNRSVPTCQLYSRSCIATFTGNRTAGCIANTCSTNTPWIQRNVLPSHVVVPIRVPSPSSTSIYDLYEQRGCPSCCPPSYRTASGVTRGLCQPLPLTRRCSVLDVPDSKSEHTHLLQSESDSTATTADSYSECQSIVSQRCNRVRSPLASSPVMLVTKSTYKPSGGRSRFQNDRVWIRYGFDF
jgi:hypothetical protein